MLFGQKIANKIVESKWPPLRLFINSLETSHGVFASWQGGWPASVFLCLHFLSDLNGQPSSIFVPFVKTPLFSLLPVAVSFLLLKKKKIRSQSSLGLIDAGLSDCAVWFVANSQSHLWCSTDCGNHLMPSNLGSTGELQSTKEFLYQFFCAGATIYWMVVSIAGQSLLPAIVSSCKIISSLEIKHIIFLREMSDKSAFQKVCSPKLLLKRYTILS